MKSFVLLLLATIATCDPIVYMIRHGEKPADGSNGLSPKGKKRAQCLRTVFGPESDYDIGYIMAQKYKKSGKRKRPYDTVFPVSEDLNLTVDVSCDRDDEECVANTIDSYEGGGNILISWQHGQMNNIVEELGAKHVDDYPSESWDLIWTVLPPYPEIFNVTSQHCPGLDD